MKANTYPRMHVSYYVSDINKSVNFYNTFFGKDADKIKPGYAKYILDEPSLVISFIQNPDRVQSNFGHLGFQVATQEEMHKRLNVAKQQGIVSKEEIGTACCYAVQDKFWVDDPDGVQWEIYYFHADSDFNDPKFENGESEVCCAAPVEKEAKIEEESCEPGSGCC